MRSTLRVDREDRLPNRAKRDRCRVQNTEESHAPNDGSAPGFAINSDVNAYRREEDMAKTHHNKVAHKKTESERPNQEQLREEIQQLAYTFYCQCGYEHGHDLEHWVEAERRVLERYQGKRKTRG